MKSTCLFLLAVCFFQITASAATRTVTSLADDNGAGTLRSLIGASAAGDTIDFSVSGTITLTQGEMLLTRGLNIVGPGAAALAISGNNADRIFYVQSNTLVNLSNLTLTKGAAVGANGTASSSPQDGMGGAIFNQGNLTLSGCVLSNNVAVGGNGYTFQSTAQNGANGYGGAIYNSATLWLNNCTVSSNMVSGGTGSVPVSNNTSGGAASGGGIYNQSTMAFFHGTPLQATLLTLSDCTLNGNSARGGTGGGSYSVGGSGGSVTGGAVINHGALVMTNCTVYGNVIGGGNGGNGEGAGGGGGNAAGGGVWNDEYMTTVTIYDSTFSGNVVNGGNSGTGMGSTTGGSAQGGGVFDSGDATYFNTIIANDTVSGGAGTAGENGPGTTGAATGPDIDGAITSAGHNFIGKSDGSSGWVASDLTGTSALPLNPLLGPLQNNGGTTLTEALLPMSAAIDAGDDNVLGLTTDQRGYPRLTGSHVDIGAFELEPSLAIARIGATAVVSWPLADTGWTLQTNKNIATSTWGSYAGVVINNRATNSTPKGNVFFRLTHP